MNIPFLCIGVAFLLIFVPRLFVARAQGQRPGGFDNRNPRDQQAKLEGMGKRAQAAHNNSFEAFAPFAAAVFVAHLGGASPRWQTILAATFVVARCLYIAAYLGDKPSLRSSVWMVGLLSTGALLVLGIVH